MNISSETLDSLVKLSKYIGKDRKKALSLLIPLAIIAGAAELSVIAVITRLFNVVVGQASQPSLTFLSNLVPADPNRKVLGLVFIFLALCWFSSISRLALRASQMRLKAKIVSDLSRKAHEIILAQPYEFFLKGDSNVEISAAILINISRVGDVIILPMLQFGSGVFMVVLLVAGILFIGRFQALSLVVLLLLGYLAVSSLITPNLRIYAQKRLSLELKANSVLMESIKSVMDIQLTNSEQFFQGIYSDYSKKSVSYIWKSEALPESPRALIEPLGISLIFAIGLAPALLSGQFDKFSAAIPFLATVAVASLKLTPPLQDVFRAITLTRSGLPDLRKVLRLLDTAKDNRLTLSSVGVPSPDGIYPKRTISLNNVSYTYPSASSNVLANISLTIPVGSRVAFVGPTGSGKTTTANIILGLLKPRNGSLSLDGIDVEKYELPAWQASCSYVPQSINLINGTLLENIAFGLPPERISLDKVWDALENAQLLDVVESLPSGLGTPVGENGLLLSGGQRQRVAIARAFYRSSKLIVLDEATSSLDNRTEYDLMKAIDLVGRKCTMIIVAHRLSTVKRADKIYEFSAGQLVASGSYDQLLHSSASFADLNYLDNLS